MTPEELAGYEFAAGSMGPKVEAAARFVAKTGGRAAIGSLADIAGIVAGTAGTNVIEHHAPAEAVATQALAEAPAGQAGTHHDDVVVAAEGAPELAAAVPAASSISTITFAVRWRVRRVPSSCTRFVRV